MDINDIRTAVTVIGLLLFLVLIAHTWSRRRTKEHEEAAMLPFRDEAGSTTPASTAPQSGTQGDRA